MAGEKLLAQGTSGHSMESCTKGGRFAFCAEPIRSDGLESAGLIGRLRMPANAGDVLGILLCIKKTSAAKLVKCQLFSQSDT